MFKAKLKLLGECLLARDDNVKLARKPARTRKKVPEFRDGNEGLVVEGLSKTYKRRPVVRNVSLSLRRGEAVGLLGPNGAGKTTVFYMITGLIAADSGSIRLDGADITHLPMYRRARLGIGYLPQESVDLPRAHGRGKHSRRSRTDGKFQISATVCCVSCLMSSQLPISGILRCCALWRRTSPRGDRPRPCRQPPIHAPRRALRRN